MKTKLKIGTLMKLAAQSELANFRWTVNQLRDHVVRAAGNCRTKQDAVEAMNQSVMKS